MNSKIVSLDEARKEKAIENEFLDLLDKDIEAGNVTPIPESIFDRVAKIKHKALVARQKHELIEM